MTDFHFGWNCKYFNPFFELCSARVESLNSRKDLMAWIRSKDAAQIFGTSKEKIQEECRALGYDYDKENEKVNLPDYRGYCQCPMIETGGICGDFDKHSGDQIRAIIDLREQTPYWEPRKPRLV